MRPIPEAREGAGLFEFQTWRVFQGATVDPARPQPIAFARVGAVLLGSVSFDETESALHPTPEPGVAVGVGATVGTDTRARDGQVFESQAISSEVAATLGAARLQGELYGRSWQDGAEDTGGYVQSSVAWPGPGLELAGRFEVLQTVETLLSADGLLNWYARGT